LSACCPCAKIESLAKDDTITLLANGVELLAAVLGREREAFLGSNDRVLYCLTADAELLLAQVPPLRTDLATIFRIFAQAKITLLLCCEAVDAFPGRVEALAEDRAIVDITGQGRARQPGVP